MQKNVCEIFLNGWKEFANNLEDEETPVPAHVSQDSDSERPPKVVSKSRKHSIFIHFPKDRNCEVCLMTKITNASCRRHTGEAVPRAEKFGDLTTADHKFSMRKVNHGTIIDTLSWNKILPLNGFSLIRVKQKLHRRRKGVRKSSSKRHRSWRFSTQTLWNLGNLVKNYPGITERLHIIDPRQTELPKQQYEEWRKEPQSYCYSLD